MFKVFLIILIMNGTELRVMSTREIGTAPIESPMTSPAYVKCEQMVKIIENSYPSTRRVAICQLG